MQSSSTTVEDFLDRHPRLVKLSDFDKKLLLKGLKHPEIQAVDIDDLASLSNTHWALVIDYGCEEEGTPATLSVARWNDLRTAIRSIPGHEDFDWRKEDLSLSPAQKRRWSTENIFERPHDCSGLPADLSCPELRAVFRYFSTKEATVNRVMSIVYGLSVSIALDVCMCIQPGEIEALARFAQATCTWSQTWKDVKWVTKFGSFWHNWSQGAYKTRYPLPQIKEWDNLLASIRRTSEASYKFSLVKRLPAENMAHAIMLEKDDKDFAMALEEIAANNNHSWLQPKCPSMQRVLVKDPLAGLLQVGHQAPSVAHSDGRMPSVARAAADERFTQDQEKAKEARAIAKAAQETKFAPGKFAVLSADSQKWQRFDGDLKEVCKVKKWLFGDLKKLLSKPDPEGSSRGVRIREAQGEDADDEEDVALDTLRQPILLTLTLMTTR